jgi:Mg-chelatase subunit ChlD
VKEGEDARRAIDDLRRRTTARRDLAASPGFSDVSPQVGELDEAAFDDLLGENPDDALSLLAKLTGAADAELRLLARRLAGRVLLRLARAGRSETRGIGRLVGAPLDAGRDLDVDGSIETLASAGGGRVSASDLRATRWARPSAALSLVIDRSGSMSGDRLASAALAAAAVALRAEDDFSVIAFSSGVLVLKAQEAPREIAEVVDDVLALRGHGPTDLELALREARTQVARSRSSRSVVVLLSDCRSTAGSDAVGIARSIERLVVVAPDDDADDARSFAAAAGAELVLIAGPASIPGALSPALSA